jgi:hypothetical protein
VIGTTQAQIQANAPWIVAWNLSQPGNAARVLAIMSDVDLVSLASLGPSVSAVVEQYAGATQLARFKLARQKALFIPPSTGLLDTVKDVYLDFLTAPFIKTSVLSALVQTTVVLTSTAQAGWNGGYYVIGPAINWLWRTYWPEGYNTLGGVIDQIVYNLIEYEASVYMVGREELQLLADLDMSVYDFGPNGTDYGDWGVMDDMTADFNLCINPGDC